MYIQSLAVACLLVCLREHLIFSNRSMVFQNIVHKITRCYLKKLFSWFSWLWIVHRINYSQFIILFSFGIAQKEQETGASLSKQCICTDLRRRPRGGKSINLYLIISNHFFVIQRTSYGRAVTGFLDWRHKTSGVMTRMWFRDWYHLDWLIDWLRAFRQG